MIRLLDTVVIKLEGGTDEDLEVLDEKPVVIAPLTTQHKPIVEKSKVEESSNANKDKEDDSEAKVDESKGDDDEKSGKRESKKRRRTHSDSSSNSSSSESDSESEKNEKASETKPANAENGNNIENESKEEVIDEILKEKEDVEMKDEEKSENEKKETEEMESVKIEEEEVVDLDKEEESKSKKLEEKHKTSSIFVRNLAPTITKAEVESLCKKYEGFLRVAIADPAVERRWFRRGWITFKRDVNIKEICWNLNNIRLRDCELAPIVNRDLSRRVRPINGITAHKSVCKNDIKICARIAHSLDEKYGLWKDRMDSHEDKRRATFGLQSKNPVLQNITDYLIEEADAEEEELLGLSSENKDDNEGEMVERDLELISVLDKIVLYLRIVHSVDFYSKFIYFIRVINAYLLNNRSL